LGRKAAEFVPGNGRKFSSVPPQQLSSRVSVYWQLPNFR